MLVASFAPIHAGFSKPSPSDTHTMALIPTAWGVCGAAWRNPEGTSAVSFVERPSSALSCRILTPGLAPCDVRDVLLRAYTGCNEILGDGRGNFHPEVAPEWLPGLTHFLQRYYSAGLRDWTLPEFRENWTYWSPRLDWSEVTPFQRKVLEVVASIPCGIKLTYGKVAALIGKPAASAAGAAIGSNPWPVLVPCHRVVGSTGKLTGFSAPGGIEAKRRMLELENA